jgi:hypothetical protein
LLAAGGHAGLRLVVMHTHGHGDHVGGDASFAGRPDTIVVGHTIEDVAGFFGIDLWLDDVGTLDLGGRKVNVLPTPGHHASHVMVYDAATRIMFSGDAIYPRRLYFICEKAVEYAASLDRVADFAETHQIDWLLGGYLDMKAAPGQSFGQQDKSRRGEHLLELPGNALGDVTAAFAGIGDYPRVTPFLNSCCCRTRQIRQACPRPTGASLPDIRRMPIGSCAVQQPGAGTHAKTSRCLCREEWCRFRPGRMSGSARSRLR